MIYKNIMYVEEGSHNRYQKYLKRPKPQIFPSENSESLDREVGRKHCKNNALISLKNIFNHQCHGHHETIPRC